MYAYTLYIEVMISHKLAHAMINAGTRAHVSELALEILTLEQLSEQQNIGLPT